jgi:hypothetical protein
VIEIEKGIEIPDPGRRKKGEGLPFGKLEVGDSFLIVKAHRKSWAFAFAAISAAQKRHDIKLTTRLVDDNTRRVWRVE